MICYIMKTIQGHERFQSTFKGLLYRALSLTEYSNEDAS